MTTQNWLLPEHLSDILPAEARRTEELRRRLLDLYRTYGFEMVTPPLVEYTTSLYAGQSVDLPLQTCKLVDQISGRTLGIRADMTPQITRIDAHLLNREGVTRLCYCGSVLHARPAGLLADRELMQIGAEVYGHAGYEADCQVIGLAIESLALAGVTKVRLDLNHPGVTRALIDAYPPLNEVTSDIYTFLKDKDIASLISCLNNYPNIPAEIRLALLALPRLYGGPEVLDRAIQELPSLPGILDAIQELRDIVNTLGLDELGIDLSDVRGYDYHCGVIFALYADGWHEAVVRGGRYDNVSKIFGRARAATGFSLDLRKLARGLEPAQRSRAIKAPWLMHEELNQTIKQLREQGNIVVQFFPGSSQDVDEFEFDSELVFEAGKWVQKPLNA
ncbi:MAG: ATP phosphoribosyltransferase regulatory subunit [Pelistega sp.]|nr:ATP phosphoribosyltransferase regulatory subunit [Pelistega sp.]